jgi:hypothetical protein
MSSRIRHASAAAIEDFVAQRTLAVVGVSRSGKKFANAAYKELQSKGYSVIPVNPAAETVEGQPCYPSLLALPGPVDGAIVIAPREQALQIVRDAAAAGIRRVWLQQGAESQVAIDACQAAGISVVAGECILMFAKPSHWIHRAHRFGRALFGSMPR